jgi:hypothetical protein
MDFLNEGYQLRVKSFLKKWGLKYLLSGLIDFILIVLAFQCSYLVNYPYEGRFFSQESNLFYLLICSLPFWILILNLIKFANIPTKRYKVLSLLYFHSALVMLVILISICFIFGLATVSGYYLIGTAFFGFLFLFSIRILEFKVFKKTASKRHVFLNLVLIADDSSLPFIENLFSEPGSRFRVLVIFTGSSSIKEKFGNESIILSEEYLGILNDLIEVDLIDEVLYIKEKLDSGEVREVIRSCEELGITLRLRYSGSMISLSSAVPTSLGNEKFLIFKSMRNNTFVHALKRTIDINIAMTMIVLLSPLYLILTILIKLSSQEPLIEKLPVAGIKGRQINLYKFRTNIVSNSKQSVKATTNSETDDFTIENSEDLRETKIGRFLRRSGFERLPQLFNVLNGDILIFSLHPSLRRDDQ